MGTPEADVYEMPIVAHIIYRTRIHTHTGIAAITKRNFFQQLVITHRDSAIRTLEDLRGKRVAQMGWYQHSMAVWLRGHLSDRFGIDPSEISWFTERPSLYDLDESAKAPITVVQDGRSHLQLLLDGDVDALIHEAAHQYVTRHLELRRVLSNYKEEETTYFRETDCFPLNHALVIRREIVDEHPWVAGSLLRAFDEAQQLAIEGMEHNNATVSSPWMDGLLEEVAALSDNLFPNGRERTRPQIERLVRHLHEQRLIPRRIPVEELFADDSLVNLPGD